MFMDRIEQTVLITQQLHTYWINWIEQLRG